MRIIVSFLALTLLAGGIYISLELVREVVNLYQVADSDLKLGVITAGGSALAFVINNAIQASRERRARFFESKREAYGAFIESFVTFFDQLDQEGSSERVRDSIKRLRRDVMIWGSANAILAFNKFLRESAEEPAPSQREAFQRTEDFLRSLRKDLGHNDTALDKFALTKMILRGDEHKSLD